MQSIAWTSIGAAVGLAVGAAAGYIAASKTLERKFEARLAEELEQTKNFYASIHKGPGFSTATEAAKTLGVEVEEKINVVTAATALSGYQGKNPMPVDEDKVVNIFSRRGEVGEVPQAEVDKRSADTPYLISAAEFMQNDSEAEQSTITWYEGDGVLADEQDQPIEDVDATVGVINLQRFGHYSGNDDVVYVRNDSRDIDYHIVRSYGKYAVEVAGFTE